MKIKVIWTAEKNPDIGSRLIMKFQRTPYSHVAIAYCGAIYHAVGEGVIEGSLNSFLETHVVVAEKEIDLKCELAEFFGYIKRAKGTEYSTSQLVAIGGRIKWLRFLFRNGRGKAICSEFVGDILVDLGGFKLDGDSDFDWTPKYLFEVLK